MDFKFYYYCFCVYMDMHMHAIVTMWRTGYVFVELVLSSPLYEIQGLNSGLCGK